MDDFQENLLKLSTISPAVGEGGSIWTYRSPSIQISATDESSVALIVWAVEDWEIPSFDPSLSGEVPDKAYLRVDYTTLGEEGWAANVQPHAVARTGHCMEHLAVIDRQVFGGALLRQVLSDAGASDKMGIVFVEEMVLHENN